MKEIAILDFNLKEVSVLKVEDYIIEEDFDDDVELYLKELGFKLSEISYMCGSGIEVNCYNGCPSGGLRVTDEDINGL